MKMVMTIVLFALSASVSHGACSAMKGGRLGDNKDKVSYNRAGGNGSQSGNTNTNK